MRSITRNCPNRRAGLARVLCTPMCLGRMKSASLTRPARGNLPCPCPLRGYAISSAGLTRSGTHAWSAPRLVRAYWELCLVLGILRCLRDRYSVPAEYSLSGPSLLMRRSKPVGCQAHVSESRLQGGRRRKWLLTVADEGPGSTRRLMGAIAASFRYLAALSMHTMPALAATL